jgi:alpha-1,2-glucosyltransferase
MVPASGRAPKAILAVAAVAVVAAGYLAFRGCPLLQDEIVHANQIRRFIRGQYAVDADLTTFPGYHVLVAAAGRAAHNSSTGFLRAVQAVIALASIGAFHFLAGRLGRSQPWTTLQYLTLPVLVPFFFLLYTDALALLAVLLSFGLAARGRPQLAGLVGALGILVRQTNAVWLALLCVFICLRHRDDRSRWDVRSCLADCAVSLVGLLVFGLFVVWHRGVAAGDEQAHPLLGLHVTNIWMLLALAAVMLLPAHLAAIAGLLRSRPHWGRELLWLAAAFALYWVTFTNTHPYNAKPAEYLRNALLAWVTSSAAARAALFVPIAGTLLSLRADPPPGVMGAALGAATLALLAATWVVDPRYDVVPLSLLLLFRPQREAWVERAIVAINAPLSLLLVWGIRSGRFFP